MTLLVFYLTSLCILAAMSARANEQFSDQDRLPMQFGLDGQPRSYAPRLWALWFTPALAALLIGGFTLLALGGYLDPAAPVLTAITFGGVHFLHLYLIHSSL